MAQDSVNTVATYATVLSSTVLRFFSYIFLRWIPGHPFPPIIWTSAAIYIASFCYGLARSEPYNILEDEVHVVARDPSPSDDDLKDVDPRYVNGKPKDPGQELDVEETMLVEAKDPQKLVTLLTGVASPSSLVWSAVTLLINLALVAMVWDLVYRAPMFYPSHDLSMARVGYVSDSSAKILVREPDESKYPIFISYRHADPPLSSDGSFAHDTAWKAGDRIDALDDSTDYTGIFTLTNLNADTRYQYVAANHSGYFTTSPPPGQLSSRASSKATFTFLHSSCLKNRVPYSPFDHPLSNKGLQYLASNLASLKANFMLFLGDFIYIDVPRRLGASTIEDYRREYRQIYSSPDWPATSYDLPWLHVYDDHEIANDWDKNTTGYFPAAFDPYTHYHLAANPAPIRPEASYSTFTSGPATFFLLDTRRYRTAPGPAHQDPSILGPHQLHDLLTWLARPEPSGVRWKVVVSSVPFTQNWWLNSQDTWRGYLDERHAVLEAMWDVGASGSGVGVIVLSGDRHEFAATAFPPPPNGVEEIVGLGNTGAGARGFAGNRDDSLVGTELKTRRKHWPQSATVHEFSASPLQMFYLPLRTYAESSTSPDYTSDACLAYIPDGNSKFGAITISQPETSDQSILYYRLFVDGKEKWSHTLTTPPMGRAGTAGVRDAIWG